MQFTFKKLESTASPLYLVQAIDSEGVIEMQWQIACDDESELEAIAQEAYQMTITPKTYDSPKE